MYPNAPSVCIYTALNISDQLSKNHLSFHFLPKEKKRIIFQQFTLNPTTIKFKSGPRDFPSSKLNLKP